MGRSGRSTASDHDRFVLMDGGKRRARPKLVAIDLDEGAEDGAAGALGGAVSSTGAYIEDEEARLLARLEARGLELVIVTAGPAAQAERAAASAGIHPIVLADISLWQPSSGDGSPSSIRAIALAELCDRHMLAFRDVCVIAAWPDDCEMLFEAGWALALESAGYEACAGADEVFPAREQGGLAQALAFLVDGLCEGWPD